jgi:hypothetical protein
VRDERFSTSSTFEAAPFDADVFVGGRFAERRPEKVRDGHATTMEYQPWMSMRSTARWRLEQKSRQHSSLVASSSPFIPEEVWH